MMGAGAGFHADFTTLGNGLADRADPLIPSEFAFPGAISLVICTMDLKHILRQINANSTNIHGGLLLYVLDW